MQAYIVVNCKKACSTYLDTQFQKHIQIHFISTYYTNTRIELANMTWTLDVVSQYPSGESQMFTLEGAPTYLLMNISI